MDDSCQSTPSKSRPKDLPLVTKAKPSPVKRAVSPSCLVGHGSNGDPIRFITSPDQSNYPFPVNAGLATSDTLGEMKSYRFNGSTTDSFDRNYLFDCVESLEKQDEDFCTADMDTASVGSSQNEAESLLDEVCDVTLEAGKFISTEVIEGLEQFAAPEESAEFGLSDFITALLTIITFYCDLASDLVLAVHLWGGNGRDKHWAFATAFMAIGPLVIVNGFSLYWYWFDRKNSKNNKVEDQSSYISSLQYYHQVTLEDHPPSLSNSSRRRFRAKEILLWILRFTFHVILQAIPLRQLDLLFYGLMSRRSRKETKKRRKVGRRNVKKRKSYKINSGDFYSLEFSDNGCVCGKRKLDSLDDLDTRDSKRRRGDEQNMDSTTALDSNVSANGVTHSSSDTQVNTMTSSSVGSCLSERWLHAEGDAAALDLIGAVLQDIPQLILQLYLLAHALPIIAKSMKRYTKYFGSISFDMSNLLQLPIKGEFSLKENDSPSSANYSNPVKYSVVDLSYYESSYFDNWYLNGSYVSALYSTYDDDSDGLNSAPWWSYLNTNYTGMGVPEELLPRQSQLLIILQLVSIVFSLGAVSWSATSWVRALRLSNSSLTNLSLASLTLITVAHMCAIVPQVLTFTILAAASPILLATVLVVLWLLNTLWIFSVLYKWSKDHHDCLAWFPHDLRSGSCHRLDDLCLSAALGMVFLVTFIDFGGSATELQMLLQALLRLLLQVVTVTAWVISSSGSVWIEFGPLLVVVVCFLLHIFLLSTNHCLMRRDARRKNNGAVVIARQNVGNI